MKMWMLIVPLLAIGNVVADDVTPDRGVALLEPFKRELQQTLLAGLKDGVVNAVRACRIQAPQIAATHSKSGVRVGRTSDRLRNPTNAAPQWVKPWLESYLAGTEREPTQVSLPGNQAGYIEPIYLKPLCLNCHGDHIAPDVAAKINALYPHDNATGFKVGDLRGLFWVEYQDLD